MENIGQVLFSILETKWKHFVFFCDFLHFSKSRKPLIVNFLIDIFSHLQFLHYNNSKYLFNISISNLVISLIKSV